MISFFVPGKPQPGGSKKSIGKHRIIDANPHVGEWRSTVALAGRNAFIESGLSVPYDCALYVQCTFYTARPKSHFDKAGKIKPKYENEFPTTRPDATKLFRSTEDALTGVVWTDDARIVEQHVSKRYGTAIGARIVILPMDDYLNEA